MLDNRSKMLLNCLEYGSGTGMGGGNDTVDTETRKRNGRVRRSDLDERE